MGKFKESGWLCAQVAQGAQGSFSASNNVYDLFAELKGLLYRVPFATLLQRVLFRGEQQLEHPQRWEEPPQEAQ
jgi:hypothetical protein